MIQIKKDKRFNKRCTHCGRWGHKCADCWYFEKEQERQKNNGKSVNVTSETKTNKDVALITDIPGKGETALLCTEIRKDVCIADSGASCHMTNTLHGMYNQRKISSKVKIGSGVYEANIICDVSGMTIQPGRLDKKGHHTTQRKIRTTPLLQINQPYHHHE